MLRHVLALSLAGALLGTSASAERFTELVTFSAAFSDIGNYYTESGTTRPEPFYHNRSTNGPVAVEVMADLMGLSAAPSLHLTQDDGGSNFSVFDATASGNGPHDVPAQVDAFLSRNDGKADPGALYFVFLGGNDVIKAFAEPDPVVGQEILNDAVTTIETQMNRLADAGAKTFYAPDFVDVGKSPAAVNRGAEAVAYGTKLSEQWNRDFDAMLDRVEQRDGIKIIRWSFNDFTESVLRNGEEFGITNTTESCVAKGRDCDFESYVYLTDEYPTARVHRLLGIGLAMGLLMREDEQEEVIQ